MDILDKLQLRRGNLSNEDIQSLVKEVKRLRQRDDMLSGLEAGGVDNWDWYSESLKDYNRKYYPEDFEDEE